MFNLDACRERERERERERGMEREREGEMGADMNWLLMLDFILSNGDSRETKEVILFTSVAFDVFQNK